MVYKSENSALARSQRCQESVPDSCAFQGFIANFRLYIPLSAGPHPQNQPSPPEPLGSQEQRHMRNFLAFLHYEFLSTPKEQHTTMLMLAGSIILFGVPLSLIVASPRL